MLAPTAGPRLPAWAAKKRGILRAADCDLLTIGHHLQPTPREHLPVLDYVSPETFAEYARVGRALGFRNDATPVTETVTEAF